MKELNLKEFDEYLDTKQSFFINRLGGSDYRSYLWYINKQKSLTDIINIISIYNGYYDTSNDEHEKEKNLQKFFSELMFIYKNNNVSYDACGFINENKDFSNNNDNCYISYHIINETRYFIDNILMKKYKNKTILIISPFSDLIEKQTKKINYLFGENSNFNFIFFKTSITYLNEETGFYMNTPHKNIFETITYYNNEINKINFDVALLSCGTYAHFLGENIKNQNKKAFYVGGILQLWFGIFGDLYLSKITYSYFHNPKYCILNNYEINHSPKTLESCNSYLFNSYKYKDILQNFDYNNYKSIFDSEESAIINYIISNLK